MLRRQNAVAETVLGSPSKCLLIAWRISRESDPIDWSAEGQSIGVALSPTNAWGRPQDDDDPPAFYEFAVADVVWAPHAFDALIQAVADERQYGLLFFSSVTQQAYAPYAGGAWLSARYDGY
jgi:hypothetical protein